MKIQNPKLKSEIAELMSLTLESEAPKHLKAIVVGRLLWTATEDNDKYQRVKYVGQRYWSDKAIAHYRRLNQGRSIKCCKGLRHEHIVPRNYLQGLILGLEDKSPEIINEILNKFAHGVVITKSEDDQLRLKGLAKKLPESFSNDENFLARYKSANTKIMDVHGKDLKNHTFSDEDAISL